MRANSLRFPEPADLTPLPIDISKPHIVRSLNCTTNKPLHLGHLRNIVLGAAMASSLNTLGASVFRHCVLEDTGRDMAEAMIGVQVSEQSGQPADGYRWKPDHFVGSCYTRYQKIAAAGSHEWRQAADELLFAVARRDESALRLQARVRSLVLDGLQATLQRIGAGFEYCDYESAEDPLLEAFVANCTGRGVLRRNDEGELLYPAYNGRKLVLFDRMGFSEESARLVSFNSRLANTWVADHVTIVIAGSEWKEFIALYGEFLFRLGRKNSFEHYVPVFYGMVTLNGKKMASSTGLGLFVDDVLDQLAADERIRGLGRCAPLDQLAAMVMKCLLLTSARTESIDVTLDRIAGAHTNPGWRIARAWAAIQEEGWPSPTSAIAPDTRVRLRDAVSRASFELVMEHTLGIAEKVLKGTACNAEKFEFSTMVTALSIAPERSDFAFNRTPSLICRTV